MCGPQNTLVSSYSTDAYSTFLKTNGILESNFRLFSKDFLYFCVQKVFIRFLYLHVLTDTRNIGGVTGNKTFFFLCMCTFYTRALMMTNTIIIKLAYLQHIVLNHDIMQSDVLNSPGHSI